MLTKHLGHKNFLSVFMFCSFITWASNCYGQILRIDIFINNKETDIECSAFELTEIIKYNQCTSGSSYV